MIVNRRKLESELSLVCLSTNEKSTVPTLKHVLLEASGEILAISATDIDTSLFGSIPVEKEGDGFSAFAPAKRLLATIRSLTGDSVEMKMTGNNRLALKCGGHRSEIPCLSRHEFARCRDEEPESWVTLPSDHFSALLRDGGFCTDPNKPPSAFQVHLEAGRLTISSTDRNNACLASGLLEGATEGLAVSALIGEFATPKIEAIASRSKTLSIGIGHTQIRVRDDEGCLLVCRKIDAEMPDLRSFLQKFKDFKVSVTIDRDDLTTALKRLSGFVDATERDELDIEIGSELLLRGGDADHGRAIETVESAKDFAGTSRFVVKFSKFLLAVRHARGERVILRYSGDGVGGPITLFNDDPNEVLGEWGFMSGTIYREAAKAKTP